MTAGASSGAELVAPGPSAFFRRRYLYLMTVLGTIYIVTAVLAPTPWVELPLGLAVLLVIPGYAIGALALGPRPRWPWSLTFALVVAWSVAVNVAQGLVLLVLGLGLSPLVLGATAFALAGAASAVWSFRALPEPWHRAGPAIAAHFRLQGYTPRQRGTAYGLLLGIVAVLAAIVYLAAVNPAGGPAVSFGITGAGGTALNLPSAGATNTTLVIWVIIGNNATAQNFTLELRSMTVGSNPPTFTSVPWSSPLMLANATVSDDPVSLGASANVTVHVQFQYAHAGRYLMEFLLENPGGAEIRSASWTITIT
jgi:uncharacterized membrane protein